jgi:hypothetical protein
LWSAGCKSAEHVELCHTGLIVEWCRPPQMVRASLKETERFSLREALVLL